LLIILAAVGIYYLTGQLLDSSLSRLFKDARYLIDPVKLVIAVLLTIVPSIPTIGIMVGFLRGEIKVYILLAKLANVFYQYSGDDERWKFLLKIIILKILGYEKFAFTTRLPGYFHAHAAGAILARQKWISVYWAPVRYWADLSAFATMYKNEVMKLPSDGKSRFIISKKADIECSLNKPDGIIFNHSLESKALTMAVYEDIQEFDEIKGHVWDFSCFDSLVMIYMDKGDSEKLAKAFDSLSSLQPLERIEKLKNMSVKAYICINRNYPSSDTEIFSKVDECIGRLMALSSTSRRNVIYNNIANQVVLG
jgi:hypothetical protein